MKILKFKDEVKPLTVQELFELEERIDYIGMMIHNCSENDSDVIDNLQKELDEIITIIENSLSLLERVSCE